MTPAPPDPGPWCHRFETDDLDALAAAQPGWRLHYDQLSPGPFHARVLLVQLPGLRLAQEYTRRALRQRGRFRAGELGLALGTTRASGGFFHGQKIDADSIMIGRGDELDLVTPEDNLLVGIVIDQALLSEVWQALYQKPWSTWLDCKVVTPARPGLAAHVREQHQRLIASVQQQASLLDDAGTALRLRDAILIAWLEAIPERVDTRGLKTAEARRQLVDRVCAHVMAQPEEPPTLLALCREVGASPRKLEYCFRDVLGLSPHKYLRAVRLNGVRRELKRPSPVQLRVHDVAARWGFWHMGSFSAEYKLQFGELPSATLGTVPHERRRPAGSPSANRP
jgi:AraC family transcriptional regulator, ethanolamine operon transcriptional activator